MYEAKDGFHEHPTTHTHMHTHTALTTETWTTLAWSPSQEPTDFWLGLLNTALLTILREDALGTTSWYPSPLACAHGSSQAESLLRAGPLSPSFYPPSEQLLSGAPRCKEHLCLCSFP